jgi:putative DNA primase/helicase
VERLTGSLAFGALARMVLMAAKHQAEGDDGRTVRLCCRAKSNIGPGDGGFAYDLNQAELQTHPGIFASFVLWGESLEGPARELLATADAIGNDGKRGSLSDAKQFLTDFLTKAPASQKTVKETSGKGGYSWATIRRAKKEPGIKPAKIGMQGGWFWQMPEHEPINERRCSTAPKMLNKKRRAPSQLSSTFEMSRAR